MPNNVIVVGASGRMGQEVVKLIESVDGYRIVAEIDQGSGYTSFNDFSGEADVVIDFSNHVVTSDLIKFTVNHDLPLVIATTGHTDEEKRIIKDASSKIPIFQSANMSVGIALLNKLAQEAVKVMKTADIEIIEKHHSRKLDAPSGTALLIADGIKSVKEDLEYVYGRGGQKKRAENELGIHAIRSGNIVGEHEVIIGTDTQTITLKHEAHDRSLFAEGALSAAEFIITQKPGLYNMENLLA